MKHLLVAIAVVMTISATAMASKIEVNYTPESDSICSQALIQLPVQEIKGVGVFAYELVSENWSEAYAGLSYSPVPQLEVALGYGLEKAPNPTRIGGWVWAGQGRVSGIYLFEDGGSGPWHKLELKYRATDQVTLGYVERAFSGEGPMVEYNLTRTDKIRIYGFEDQTEISLIHSF